MPILGKGVAEMDFGWWDPAERTMHLLELRDYSRPEQRIAVDFLVAECVQKATDCLLMLVSVWHAVPAGPALSGCVPEEWRKRPDGGERVRLTFVVKRSNTDDRTALGPLQSRVRDKLRGRLELLQLGVTTMVFVMDHGSARKTGLPIQTVEDAIGALAEAPSRGRGKRR
ncbi:hypothetical protein ACMHYB_52340 [Sorangium sp. So ce1128]